MNEGDSAGGGHQGNIPAPPAVPIHRPNLTITTSNVAPNAASNISNSNNSRDIIKRTTSTILTIVTTNSPSNTTTTSATSSSGSSTTKSTTLQAARSFQQAFTQHQQQKTTDKTVALQVLHMPQNSSTSLKGVVAATAAAAAGATITAKTVSPAAVVGTPKHSQQQLQQQQQQQHQLLVTTDIVGGTNTGDTPPPAKRYKYEIQTSNTTDFSLVSGLPINVAGSLLPATTTGSTPDNSNNLIKTHTTPQNVVATLGTTTPSATKTKSTIPTSTTTVGTTATTPQEFQALKKRVLEYKYLRLRNLKEKHNENVAELFYLQSGGNMMEYPVWRKKPPTQQLTSFSNSYRLNQLVGGDKVEDVSTNKSSNEQQQPKLQPQQQQQPTAENIATIIGVATSSVQSQQTDSAITGTTKSTPTNQSLVTTAQDQTTATTTTTLAAIKSSSQAHATTTTVTVTATVTATSVSTNASHSVSVASTEQDESSSLPQGAEIKIPAVGATPVAVSTKLPAAVVQLSQQGHIPGRPLGGRHGMVFGQISTVHAVGNTSSVPLVPGGTPLVPCTTIGGTAALRKNGNQTRPTTPSAVGSRSTSPPPLYTPTNQSSESQSTTTNGGSSSISCSISSGIVAGGAGNSAQEFSFKAKQEVYVMQRISELQREGLWTEKRLPKLQEPGRMKAHWDYLLEEMVWLATDFAQERKWKKNAAKKCARMVQKYFQDKANAAQKAEKAQEAHQRRVAAFIAKEIKYFWSNVEKLVEYKHHTKLEEKRKKALDQHLSFIVDQTEKFSQQLAEGMNKSLAADVSATTSLNVSRRSSPKPEDVNVSDDDFRPDTGSEDDEETIAKAEKDEQVNVKEEIAALEKESQMEFDDFLNDLPAGYLENRQKLMEAEEKQTPNKNDEEEDDDDGEEGADQVKEKDKSSSESTSKPKENDEDDADAEFEANEESEDDENTISKQEEEEEMEVDHQKEINELEADNDLTVEQLMEKYKTGKADETTSKKTISTADKRKQTKPLDSDDDEEEEEEAMDDVASEASTVVDDGSSAEESDVEDEESENETATEAEDRDKEEEGGLKSLLDDEKFAGNNKDDMIKDAAALAESIQPKGNTLSSTDVVTPVPFLLKHTLREYQHIGLDWLVTMNERKLNGILADEMGLGKTIQTIALLAHLACVKGNWGPHLIVVPSSVMLNWEMEFKKWCPGFKILTYYGTQKERKMKRVGWTKPNAFHVCITSYKLVVQDQQSFRRKKWKYLILDEAQNIKNFKSQRWQLLLNFSTERRLLLTGTPLQNDLMELWSLMHFLMPYVFSSHREFKEWFSNPMTGMIEGNMEYNETLITRLHKVIRPFLLRRLKKEVEKQMPKKYEHVVMCRLSNRQRYLYDDFMSRAKTKETLQTGSLLSVINVLMQLRKVCNHPNMFEVRPTISPFQMEGIVFQTPRLVCDLLEYDPFTQIDLKTLSLVLVQLELTLTAYASYRSQKLGTPRQLIEEIDSLPQPPPSCPRGKFKFHIRVRNAELQENISRHHASLVRVGASPAMKTEGNQLLPVHKILEANNGVVAQSRLGKRMLHINPINPALRPKIIQQIVNNSKIIGNTRTTTPITLTTTRTTLAPLMRTNSIQSTVSTATTATSTTTTKVAARLVQGSGSGKPYLLLTSTSSAATALSSNLANQNRKSTNTAPTRNLQSPELLATIAKKIKSTKAAKEAAVKMEIDDNDASSETDPVYNMAEIVKQRKAARLSRLKLMAEVNRRRLDAVPIYGSDCRDSIFKCSTPNQTLKFTSWQTRGYLNCITAMQLRDSWTLSRLLKSYEQRCTELRHTFANYVIYVPSTCAPSICFNAQHLSSTRLQQEQNIERTITQEISPKLTLLHPIISAMTTQFPDPRLIQYDCGKLQTLDRLLRQLKSEQHRVLIFTQMTKMLDVLEAFLNHHGHIYLRLDGSTRIEQRQVLMERFNGDKRIFCFILSTRSGGVGINLTGADTVIFYDSDWNPTMDAQAQDRCHRIGQTRDVHIYRLVSEKTIEVNILKKANQKRMLSDMAIEGGNFTTTYFKSSTIKDLFNVEQNEQEQQTESQSTSTNNCIGSGIEKPATSKQSTETLLTTELSSLVGGSGEIDVEKQSLRVFETALAAAEDEQDVQATKTAKAEAAADLAEFDETIPIDEATTDGAAVPVELSKADLEMQNLVKQLSPIERYAMRFVEETGAAWTAEQLRAAEEEIEAQKREWEANRLAAMQKEEEMLKQDVETDEMLTYNRRDAGINQVNKSQTHSSSRRKPNITNKKTLHRRRQLGLAAVRQRDQNDQKDQKETNNQVALKSTKLVKNNRQTNQRQNQNQYQNQHSNENVTVNRRNCRVRDSVRQEQTVGIRRLSRSNKMNVAKAGQKNAAIVANDNKQTTTNVENLCRKTTRASIAAAANFTDSINDNTTLNEISEDENEDEEEEENNEVEEEEKDENNEEEEEVKDNNENESTIESNVEHGTDEENDEIVTKAKSQNSSPNKTGVKNQKLLKFAAKRRAKRKRTTSDNLKETTEIPNKQRKISPSNLMNKNASQQFGKRRRRRRRRNCTISNLAPRRHLRSSPLKKDTELEQTKTDSDSESVKEHKVIVTDVQNTNTVAQTINRRRLTLRNADKKLIANVVDHENANDESLHAAGAVKQQSKNKRFQKVNNTNDNDLTVGVAVAAEDSAHSSYATASDGVDNSDDAENGNDSDEATANNSDNERDDDVDDQHENFKNLNHNNMDDAWNAHAQLNDNTNATNSTYYNVSEESDSDENETLAQLSTATATATTTHSISKRAGTPNVSSKTTRLLNINQRSSTSSPTAKQLSSSLNCVDVNSPRTRSRGSVKINLWTLDVSPVLPGVTRKPRTPVSLMETDVSKSEEMDVDTNESMETKISNVKNSENENKVENITKSGIVTKQRTATISSTPVRTTTQKIVHPVRRTLKRLSSSTNKNSNSDEIAGCKQPVITLHRWLLKTPRSNSITSIDAAANISNGGGGCDEDSDASNGNESSISTATSNGLIATTSTS